MVASVSSRTSIGSGFSYPLGINCPTHLHRLVALCGIRLRIRLAHAKDRRDQSKEQGMRAVMMPLIFFIASNASAQQVYKCVRGSEVSYQSAACDGTQKVARQWDATPEPEPTADELRQRQLKNQIDQAESTWLSRAAGTDRMRSASNQRNAGSRKSSMSRCDAAKARREAKLKSVGLKRTFDLLQKLDDAVNDACK